MAPSLRVALIAVCALTAGCVAADQSTSVSPASGSPAPPAFPSHAAASPGASPVAIVEPTAPPEDEPQPSDAPTATPTAQPTSEPTHRPKPTPTPAAAPLDPKVVVLVNDHSGSQWIQVGESGSVTAQVRVKTRDLDRSRCRLMHHVEPDRPWIDPGDEILEPLRQQPVELIDGLHQFLAVCQTADGPVRYRNGLRAYDGLPERCLDWTFRADDISVDTLAELEAGMHGSWHGCVSTPWTVPYWVTVTFHDDGTYSAHTDEAFDGNSMIALYYGTDEDSAQKRWWVNDLQDSGKGIGEMDLYFGPKNTVRDELRNIKLMGDKLELELFHLGNYGPVLLQLVRG